MSRRALRRLGLVAAIVITSLVGLAPTVPAHAQLTNGWVAGFLTEPGSPNGPSAGTPIPNARVVLYDLEFNWLTDVVTGDGGDFLISDVAAGSYKLGFELPGMLTQFHPAQLVFDDAEVITVADGVETTVYERALPHGAVGGQITTASGEPAGYAYVLAHSVDLGLIAQISADADGRYLLPFVPPGQVRVEVWPEGDPNRSQWAHQRRSEDEADVFDVAVDQVTTVDERLLASGAITGRVTTAGEPAHDISVTVQDVDTGATAPALTNEDGIYRAAVLPGTYTVSFEIAGGLTQWAHQKLDSNDAERFTVVAGEETVVDEALIPLGTVSGHITTADGTPAAGVEVEVTDEKNVFLYATTDEDGAYAVAGFPGTYKVRLATDRQQQWATGKLSPFSADRFTVTGGQTTVVDDRLLPTGTVAVTASDAAGTPVTSFCVTTSPLFLRDCTQNGTATLVLGPGSYELRTEIEDNPDYLPTRTEDVVVSGGATTAVAVTLTRSATVTLTARDAATGAPVADACLDLVRPDQPQNLGARGRGCTDASGRLTVRQVELGPFVPFVWANDGVHGHQWVGPHGGVGAMDEAKIIKTRSGVATNLTVRLDKAGTITGLITDRTTGEPLEVAVAGLSTYNFGFGPGPAQFFTDRDGRYTIENLGPYRWTLLFDHFAYAAEWSGGVASRTDATGVRVRTGKATRYDVGLRRGTLLTGVVTGPDGQPVGARVTVINALTHDPIGFADTDTGRYEVRVLGTQKVKLAWLTFGTSINVPGWHDNADDFAHAKTVTIPASGTKTVNIHILNLD